MPSEERQRDGRSQTQTVRDWRATKDKSEAREETVELQNPPLSAIKIDGAIKHRLFLYARKIWTPAGGSEDVGRILRTFKIKKNVEVTDNGKIII